MMKMRGFAVAGVIGLVSLTGCFSSVHQVARVQTVGTYKTSTVQELEAGISQRDAAVHTLNAGV